MFGLESHKKKKPNEEFVFELEKELKDPAKFKSIKQKVEQRLQKVKEFLRSGGEDQEEFERFGALHLGYDSVLKIMNRAVSKKK